LQYTKTGDSLCDLNYKVIYDKMNFPEAVLSMSVLPKAKGDEDKISVALKKLTDEDPVFKITRDLENAETIISGLGEIHLEVISSKFKNKFGVEVILILIVHLSHFLHLMTYCLKYLPAYLFVFLLY